MIPTSFDESDAVLDKPKGMSHEECAPLSIVRAMTGDGHAVVISCWKLTPEELAEITRTGRVWLMVYGETMPPVCMEGRKPF